MPYSKFSASLIIYRLFLYKQRFHLQKIKKKIRNTLRLNVCYLKVIRFVHSRYHPKIIGAFFKKCTRNKEVCLNEVRIAMKMRLEMKHKSHIYHVNRPRPRHGHEYNIYKMCLTIMIAICIKQLLSNICSSIHKKVKQH